MEVCNAKQNETKHTWSRTYVIPVLIYKVERWKSENLWKFTGQLAWPNKQGINRMTISKARINTKVARPSMNHSTCGHSNVLIQTVVMQPLIPALRPAEAKLVYRSKGNLMQMCSLSSIPSSTIGSGSTLNILFQPGICWKVNIPW